MASDPKSKPNSIAEKLEKLPLESAFADHALRLFEDRLRSALERRHSFLVAQVARRLRGSPLLRGAVRPAGESGDSAGEWLDIESLSRLRSVVGGRFQNLRERWVNAGFPLREHRGDKGGSFAVDERGWTELSNWVLAQGYEARVVTDRPGCLFQLRAIKSKG